MVERGVALAALLLAIVASPGVGGAQERALTRVDAEETAMGLADSLRATEDALVSSSGAAATGRAQTEIQITIAQLEDLARLLREGASQREVKERYRTLQVQRRRLAALSAAPGSAAVPREIVEAAAAHWAALAAYVASPR